MGGSRTVEVTPHADKDWRKGGPEAQPSFHKMLLRLATGRRGERAGYRVENYYGCKPVYGLKSGRYRMFYQAVGKQYVLLGFESRATTGLFNGEG